MEPNTSMELMNILAAKYQDKQCVKKIMKYCGPEKYEVYDKPLAAMSHEEDVQIVLKWIGCNSINGQLYDLRIWNRRTANDLWFKSGQS